MSQSNPTPDLFSEPMVHFGVSSVWDAEFYRTCKQADSGVALLAIAAGVDPDAQAVARASLADVTGRIEAEVARREDDEASKRRAERLQPEED